MWYTRVSCPVRFNLPSRCIRQLESHETRVSAPLFTKAFIFSSAIAVETSGIFTAKVPPNPQQSSSFSQSRSSNPSTLLVHPLEDERVVMGDHRGAGAGGTDNIIPALLLEDVQEVAGDGTGLIKKPGVEGWLAAAGLILEVDKLDTEPPQDPHHADAYLGLNEVHVARNE